MSRKTVKISLLVIALAVLFMAGTKSSMAQSATVTRTTMSEPMSTNFWLTCDTFEEINFTGSVRTVAETINSHDGSRVRVKITDTWDDVVGTTASGRVYRGTLNSKDMYDLDFLPSYFKTTQMQRFKSKTPGAADTFLKLIYRWRVDIDGNITRERIDERTMCTP
jgi:hypothetical protein